MKTAFDLEDHGGLDGSSDGVQAVIDQCSAIPADAPVRADEQRLPAELVIRAGHRHQISVQRLSWLFADQLRELGSRKWL